MLASLIVRQQISVLLPMEVEELNDKNAKPRFRLYAAGERLEARSIHAAVVLVTDGFEELYAWYAEILLQLLADGKVEELPPWSAMCSCVRLPGVVVDRVPDEPRASYYARWHEVMGEAYEAGVKWNYDQACPLCCDGVAAHRADWSTLSTELTASVEQVRGTDTPKLKTAFQRHFNRLNHIDKRIALNNLWKNQN